MTLYLFNVIAFTSLRKRGLDFKNRPRYVSTESILKPYLLLVFYYKVNFY